MKANQAEINRLHNLKFVFWYSFFDSTLIFRLQNAIQEVRQEERRQLERVAQDYEVKLKDRQRIHRQELEVMERASPKTMERLAENNRHLYKKLVMSFLSYV